MVLKKMEEFRLRKYSDGEGNKAHSTHQSTIDSNPSPTQPLQLNNKVKDVVPQQKGKMLIWQRTLIETDLATGQSRICYSQSFPAKDSEVKAYQKKRVKKPKLSKVKLEQSTTIKKKVI